MQTHDLTAGSISQHLVRLAAPLILGNTLQQLYNTIDALVLGRCCGQAEFAAIGVAGSVMNLFLFAVVGGCTGVSVLFAQQYGARDLKTFRRQHFLSLAAGLPVVAALGALGILALPALLRLIQTPPVLIVPVRLYLAIVLAGLPGTFFYNLYSGMLRAVGSTRTALAALAAAVAANLALDLWFVAGLGLGIAGAAAATVAAQAFSAILCLLCLRRGFPQLLFARVDCKNDPALLKRTAHFALVTGLHQCGLYLGKLMVQGAVNTGGTGLISAYTATTRIEGFANSFGDSGAAATSVLVAQNLGAGNRERVRQSFWKSLALLGGMGIVCSAALYFAAGWSARLLLGTADAAALESAVSYLRLVALFYTFCFTGNTFAGYFNGCGRVSVPLAGALGHISLRAVLAWLLVPRMGLNAVALATGIGWVLVNLFWALIYGRVSARSPQEYPQK